jgi:hypothetical protein
MKLSAEEKARRKEERAELKTKQARDLENCITLTTLPLRTGRRNSKVFAIMRH